MDDKTLIAYLASHPDALIRHQQILRAKGVKFPPALPNVIDVTSKIAHKARLEARKATETNQTLLTVAAENMLHWQDLHLATLGFLACNDLNGFAQMIHDELPLIFGLAHCQLFMADQNKLPQAESLGFITVPQKELSSFIGEDNISLGRPTAALSAHLGNDTSSVAVMRLPDQLPEPVCGALLVLGGKDDTSFTKGKGRALLLHLSEMIGVCLYSLIETSYLPQIEQAIE